MSLCLLSESVPKYQMKRANKARPMEKDVIGVILYYLFNLPEKQGRETYKFLSEKQPNSETVPTYFIYWVWIGGFNRVLDD